ncbi:MAG: FAD-dependent oxidoreductase, partial [Candidatus Baldrarchaeia archaeon]
MREFDVVVIGCGAAGLMSAYELSKRNNSVLVVSRGLGATAMSSGTIDLMGYFPSGKFVETPMDAVKKIAEKYPQHPYGVLGGGFEVDSDERKKNATTRVK